MSTSFKVVNPLYLTTCAKCGATIGIWGKSGLCRKCRRAQGIECVKRKYKCSKCGRLTLTYYTRGEDLLLAYPKCFKREMDKINARELERKNG